MQLTLFVLVGMLAGAPSGAEQASCAVTPVQTADEAEAALDALKLADCLGGAACTTRLCQDLNKVLAAAPAKEDDVRKALDALLQGAKETSLPGPQAEKLRAQMGIDLARYLDSGSAAAARWTLEDLTLFKDGPSEINVVTGVLAGCSGSSDCSGKLAASREILTLAGLFKRVLTKVNEERHNAFEAYMRRLDTQWQAYLGSARGQFPWELALNGIRYRKSSGFDAPPTSQLILLHPGAAYEIVRNSADRNPSATAIVEIAGVYKWSWTEQNAMRQRWGGSIGLSWRDTGGLHNMGYAAIVYLPRASSIGYVWRPQDQSDEHALLLSADLAKFLMGTASIREKLIGK